MVAALKGQDKDMIATPTEAGVAEIPPCRWSG
jgi:hypothetical protein